VEVKAHHLSSLRKNDFFAKLSNPVLMTNLHGVMDPLLKLANFCTCLKIGKLLHLSLTSKDKVHCIRKITVDLQGQRQVNSLIQKKNSNLNNYYLKCHCVSFNNEELPNV
jgi:hypothetical protein